MVQIRYLHYHLHFFMSYHNILPEIFKWKGLLLATINTLHIYTSYEGFSRLNSGVSYSIFYIYPIFILLLSGIKLHWYFFLPILAVTFISYFNWISSISLTNKKNIIIGLLSIISTAFTEAIMYFIVKSYGSLNKWNIPFIAYLIPSIILTLILNKNIIPKTEEWKKNLIILIIGNSIIGAIGYFLRFYTIGKLSTSVWSILSYFGIVTAYIYGWVFNKDQVIWGQIVGSILILLSSYFIYSRK